MSSSVDIASAYHQPQTKNLLARHNVAVIPLLHQRFALQRATASNRVRFLLADEVGLGKIEAGLVLRELKTRGLVRRVLIVAPRSLLFQWLSEMQTHFREDFRIVEGEHVKVLRDLLGLRSEGDPNPWRLTADR